MSDFKLKKIGQYKFTTNKSGKEMVHLILDMDQLAKVKSWDLDKIYIYEPKQTGDILGLIKTTEG